MRMRVLGQFNLGFIIAALGGDLFILDQHACDEKVQFEYLQKSTTIHEQRLLVCVARAAGRPCGRVGGDARVVSVCPCPSGRCVRCYFMCTCAALRCSCMSSPLLRGLRVCVAVCCVRVAVCFVRVAVCCVLLCAVCCVLCVVCCVLCVVCCVLCVVCCVYLCVGCACAPFPPQPTPP
jgi:hypothetical protein